MFSNLFFLILIILTITLVPQTEGVSSSFSPGVGFSLGMIFYLGILGLIYLQNRWLNGHHRVLRKLLLLTVNSQLLLFNLLFFFGFYGHRFFQTFPFIGESQFVPSLFALSLFFFGLAWHHRCHYRPRPFFHEGPSPWEHAWLQIRFIIPFTCPFLTFELLYDLLNAIPYPPLQHLLHNPPSSQAEHLLELGVTVGVLILMLLFLPVVIQYLWGCKDLPPSPLKSRLEDLCRKAQFRHGGLKLWTVMRHGFTAAIIGILPRFRYILFTKKLLQYLPEEEITAILAHEIGHSYRKHLIIYPFVILGMVVLFSLFSLFLGNASHEFLALQSMISPDSWWDTLGLSLLLGFFVILAALYVRFIFGFFSRLFERQADLHVFHLDVPPEYLCGALDSVAELSGDGHKTPNWHHYSIQQRMDFLQLCSQKPELIHRHHRRVRRTLWAYFFLLFCSGALLFSPLFSDVSGFHWIHNRVTSVSDTVQEWVSAPLREELADTLVQRYDLSGSPETLRSLFLSSLTHQETIEFEGVLEFYTAQLCLKNQLTSDAVRLMTVAWQHLDFNNSEEGAIVDFLQVSQSIVRQAVSETVDHELIQDLINETLLAEEFLDRDANENLHP